MAFCVYIIINVVIGEYSPLSSPAVPQSRPRKAPRSVQGKKTLVNGNERMDLIVTGLVDPRWIDANGRVFSYNVANLQFAMNGAGTVSRGQNEGILDRTIRTIF